MMDFDRFIPIIKKITEVTFNLGLKTGEVFQDTKVAEEIFSSLDDGTIDPGDSDDATNRLLQFLHKIPEYEEMLEFHRTNRKKLAELNMFLAKATDSQYMEYINALQRITSEMAVENVFKLLRKRGIIKDRS